MTQNTPADQGRADALVALERARKAYALADMELPVDPEILTVAAAFAPPRAAYEEHELRAYESAWWNAVFYEAMGRMMAQLDLAAGTLTPDEVRAAANGHVCDEECAIAALLECRDHGALGMADDEQGAKALLLQHLKEYHPRRGHHEIARLTEELGR